jgi:hypothetical protein
MEKGGSSLLDGEDVRTFGDATANPLDHSVNVV